MREVATGVWRWKAAHPEWNPGQKWIGWSPPTPLARGRASWSSTRSRFPPASASARRRSCSRVRGTVATRSSSACRSTCRAPDAHDPDPVRGEVFRGGDALPFGVRAFEALEPNDLVLYVESRRAVVAGDTLIDRGNGLQVHPDWPGPGIAPRKWPTPCARCSTCPSTSCSRRMPIPQIARRSSARCL